MFFDLPFLYFIQEHMVNPFLDGVMPFASFLGNSGMIWIVLAIVMIIMPKTRAYGVMMAVALILVAFFGEMIIKPMIGRPRPCNVDYSVIMLIKRPNSFSFPSGHSSSSFAAATFVFLYHKKLGTFAFAMAVLIAFSRMYLFVHYPTDVLCGSIFGVLTALMIYMVYKKHLNRRNKEANRIETP